MARPVRALRMDPDLKRKIRLIVALSAAVLLAAALIYTSFSSSTEAKQPSDLLNASPDRSYELTGVVLPGSIHHRGSQLDFRVADRDDSSVSIPVRYTGEVPDPFADGREVIVTGRVEEGTFMAQRDSLITKCPSKFATEAQQDPQHVVISGN
ncbi:MAG TPA: cytochrome c maturation protein CcmE [Solirubrobacterales bacterium]|nr:cytochrome c maturation protein CcmE [Solirubrobacterales bacterium]